MHKKLFILFLVILTWTIMILGFLNIIQSSNPIKAIYFYIFMFLYIVVLANTLIGLKYIFQQQSNEISKKRYKD